MSDMGKAVFLSYASQDAEAAKRICDALQAAGVEVWFDQSELTGGDAWDQKIRGQIKTCALFVPIISANTNARREGYFRREWKLAVDRTHDMDEALPFLVPVVVDGTTDAGAFVPEKFREVQWTRIASGDSSGAFCERVKKLLVGDAAAPSSPASPTSPARPAPGRRFSPAWRFVLITLAILLLVGGGVVIKRFKDGAANRPTESAQSAPLSEARKLVAQARALFEDGDDLNRENFFLAEELLKRAVALDPTDGEVWAAQAQVSADLLYLGHDPSNARREALRTQAERAVKLAPESVEAQTAYVGYLASLPSAASNQQAVELGRRIAARDATKRRLWRRLGYTLVALNRLDEAMAAYDRANSLPGGDPLALADKGMQFMWVGNHAAAETTVAASLALRPTGRAQVLDVLLKLCWRGDLDAAAAAVNHWPAWLLREPRGAFMASQVWLWRREPDKAAAVIGALSIDALNDNFFLGPKAALMALAHEMAGRADAARAEWEIARRVATRMLAENISPRRVQALKAVALARLGEGTEAESLFRELEQTRGLASDFWSVTAPSALLRIALGQGAEVPARFDREPRGAVWNSFSARPRAPQAALRLNPVFDPIRNTPEFQRWLETAPAPAVTQRAERSRPANAKSIAVLPFVNLGADKGDEYLGDGLTEELLSALSQIKALRVPGRSSCFAFKGKTGDDVYRQVGEKLQVSTVLEGTVRKVGEKLRITAQLINVADGSTLWSKPYDGDMKDILAVQTEVAQRVVEALQLQLGVNESRALTKKPTENSEAHRLYLLGRFYGSRTKVSDWNTAIGYFQRALELDPKFAMAYCGWADAYAKPNSPRRGRDMWAKARELAEKALTLDPNLAEAHLSLGKALCCTFNWPAGTKSFDRAIALNPNLGLAFDARAWVEVCHGRFDTAIAAARIAVGMDPLDSGLSSDLGYFLLYARRYEEAKQQLVRTLELDPGSAWATGVLAWCVFLQGDIPAAMSWFEKSKALDPQQGMTSLWVYAHAVSGDRAKAESVLREFESRTQDGYLSPGVRAHLYLGLGEDDKALDLLEKCYEDQDWFCWYFKVRQTYDRVRSHPRFQALLKKTGLDP